MVMSRRLPAKTVGIVLLVSSRAVGLGTLLYKKGEYTALEKVLSQVLGLIS
jgi:hypothetical protein